MTLELKRKGDKNPYTLGAVHEVTNETKYGKSTFSITIFDTRVFRKEDFDYIKDADSDKYFIKDGEWVKDVRV